MKKIMVYVLLVSAILDARYHEVKRIAEFDRLVSQYDMSVICFAPSIDNQDLGDKDVRREYRDVLRMVKNAADRDEFKNLLGRDIGFLMVDTSKPDMHEVAQENGIEVEPLCFVLNQDHSAATSPKIKPVSSYDLIRLLDQVGGTSLQNLIREKKEDKRLEREERIAYWRANPGFYGYYGWGRPLGWGPYWGPGFGCGAYWY